MRFSPHGPAGVVSVAILVVAPLCPALRAADTVQMKDGTQLSGRVVELGGCRIGLASDSGSRKILKSAIERVIFDEDRPSREVADRDVVVRRDNRKIVGEVTELLGGERVKVTLDSGSHVILPRRDILRIIRKGDSLGSDATVYTRELRRSIDEAIEALRTGSESEAARAEEFLAECGIFAIGRVREELAKARAGDAALAGAADGELLGALARLDRLYRLKEVVDPAVEEAEPAIYELLSGGDVAEQQDLLLFVFQRFAEEAVPLARVLASDELGEGSVRAWSIEFLRRMQRNRELLDIYRRTSGASQVAAAIALGKNRILVGVPALIESLELGSPEMRELAIEALRELTRQSFRFRPTGAPAAREEAVAAWWAWWREHEEEALRDAEKILRQDGTATTERLLAAELWGRARGEIAKERFEAAVAVLRQAMEADPTYYIVRLNLALLLYSRLGQAEEAERLLESLAADQIAGVAFADQGWIYLHLGHVRRLLDDTGGALEAYHQCVTRQPENVQAIIALGAMQRRLAVGGEDVPSEQRRELLDAALKSLRTAVELVDRLSDEMVLLRFEDLPFAEKLPFDRREYNQTVVAIRRDYRLQRAEALFDIAKIEALLGRDEAALLSLRKTIQEVSLDKGEGWRELEVRMRTYLGLRYEEAAKPLLALRQYRHVLRNLDPDQSECRQGIERLRRHLGDSAEAHGN